MVSGAEMLSRIMALFEGRHTALQRYGLLLVYSILMLWLVVTWAGWVLIFAGVGQVEQTTTGIPASPWQVVYYVGVTITALGQGDFVAVSGIGQAATMLCALNGLVYLFGKNAGFGTDSFLIDVAGRVEQTTQQHFSYPVLHYFHSEHRRTALSPSVARLDEALMLTLNTAPPEADLSPAVPLVLRMTRGFLEAISPTFIEPANAAPSIPPDHDADWAVTPEIGWEQFSAHRRLLKGFVETEAWSWDDVGSTDSPT